MSESSTPTPPPASGTPGADQRGFEVKRRRRWPWIVGAAVVVLAIVSVFVVRGVLSTDSATASGDHFTSDLKVAYLSTDAAQQALLEYIADDVAPDHGITIEPVGIGDPNQLQQSVSDGEIAGTIYAHKPWIEQSDAAGGTTLVAVQPVFQWAYSLWSSKYDSFEALPDGAKIGILDDPANTAQALLLLANDGVITLDPKVDPAKAALTDITANPRNFQFTPIAFGSAARSLDDFDGIISYNFEFVAAGTPAEDKIYAPEAPLVFAGQLAVSKPYLDEPNIKKLEEAFADPKVADYLKNTTDPAVQGQLTVVSDK